VEGVDVYRHSFLTSVLTVGEWSATRPFWITLGEGGPCTNGTGDRVGPGDGVND